MLLIGNIRSLFLCLKKPWAEEMKHVHSPFNNGRERSSPGPLRSSYFGKTQAFCFYTSSKEHLTEKLVQHKLKTPQKDKKDNQPSG